MTETKPRLRRAEASVYLLERHGMQLAPQTLVRYAVEGGGPKFQKNGRFAVYHVDELDTWAMARLGAVVSSTSELKRAS